MKISSRHCMLSDMINMKYIFESRIKHRFVVQFHKKLADEGNYFSKGKCPFESSLRCRENEILWRQLSCSGNFRGIKRPMVYETGTQFLAFVMSVIVGSTTAQSLSSSRRLDFFRTLARNAHIHILACVVKAVLRNYNARCHDIQQVALKGGVHILMLR